MEAGCDSLIIVDLQLTTTNYCNYISTSQLPYVTLWDNLVGLGRSL